MSWAVTPWESFETAVEICSTFFAILGVAFVAVCVRFDGRSISPLQFIRPYARWLTNSLWVLVLFVAMGVGYLCIFPEYIDAEDGPPTTRERIVAVLVEVALWPMVAVAETTQVDSGPLYFLLFFLSGLFWGLVAEAILFLSARWKIKRQKFRD